jgi:N-acetylglucosaminyldiphosphoundecaprenol N-acetyl-beta-D-mannosaminyltransferase
MSDPFARDVWAIMGMPLDNVTLDEAAGLIERAVETRERLSFVTPNVNWLVRALKDDTAMQQIVNADLSVADGAPVVWLARQLGMPLKERVAGSDLFERLRRDKSGDAKPIRVFFFGGRDGAAEAACMVLAAEGGRIIPAGWHNPGFGSVEDMTTADIQAKINAAKPDFVLVALGAAKGQAWIEANLAALEAPVIAHLGAVVDFVAGSINRAPRFISRIGMEWVWRIVAEPSLWKRYWTDGWALLSLVRGRLGKLKKASAPQNNVTFAASVQDDKIMLSGPLTHKNQNQIRDTFRTVELRATTQLDLSEADAIDAAGLGQIRMLQHAIHRHNGSLVITLAPHLNELAVAAGLKPLLASQPHT